MNEQKLPKGNRAGDSSERPGKNPDLGMLFLMLDIDFDRTSPTTRVDTSDRFRGERDSADIPIYTTPGMRPERQEMPQAVTLASLLLECAVACQSAAESIATLIAHCRQSIATIIIWFRNDKKAQERHHHIAGQYLLGYAQEASWREDNRLVDNGAQVSRLASLAMKRKPSITLTDEQQTTCTFVYG
jgi:hypothetical protein